MEAKDVELIECHGTGTALGDPIEVDALKGVLGEMLGDKIAWDSIQNGKLMMNTICIYIYTSVVCMYVCMYIYIYTSVVCMYVCMYVM